MGCAIGLSLASIVEIAYWILIRPFGFPRSTCKNCLKNFKTHYTSLTHEWYANLMMITATALYLAYATYRLYLVFNVLYINPPQPEEVQNQIAQKPEPFFNFLKFW